MGLGKRVARDLVAILYLPSSIFDSLPTLFVPELAQQLERINPCFVAVAEIDLVGVVADRGHGRGANRPGFVWFQYVEYGRGLGPFVPASGARTAIAQDPPGDAMCDAIVPLHEQRFAVSLKRFQGQAFRRVVHGASITWRPSERHGSKTLVRVGR